MAQPGTMLLVPVLDFAEIPEAHVSSGKQDSFELFSADFLEMLGYEIQNRPARGPDLGKDFIACETRSGIGGQTKVRWLVSCKHKAHSGKAVGLDDELNIIERVEGHKCAGFIACYSTLPSSSLSARLEQLRPRFEVQVLDSEKIETQLLTGGEGIVIAKRYMPTSTSHWEQEHWKPAKIFSDTLALPCDYCGANLLDPVRGIYVVWRKWDETSEPNEIVDFRWCCKGQCDRNLKAQVRASFNFEVRDSWDDIADMCTPTLFIRRVMSWINRIHGGENWAAEAFERLRTLIVTLFPHVSRPLSTADREAVQRVQRIPSFLGGMGEDV